MKTPVLEGVWLRATQNQELSSQNLASTHQHIWGPYGPWFLPLENTDHFPSLVTLGPSFFREVFNNANDMLVFSELRALNPTNRYTSEKGHGLFQGECLSICSVPGPVPGSVDLAVTKTDPVPALLELRQTDGERAAMREEKEAMRVQRSCLTPPKGSG